MTVSLVFLFLICFLGIVITAFWATEAIKAVSKKFRLSETFIGAVFLSVGTSFPEFVNAIYSGIKDRGLSNPITSLDSFYNITGANTGQIVFLAVVMSGLVIYGKKKGESEHIEKIVKIFGKDSTLSGKLLFSETLILIPIFFYPFIFSHLTVRGFSLINLMLMGVWIYYIVYTYKHHKTVDEEPVKYFTNLSKTSLIFTSLALGVLFGTFSCINFYISSKFEMDKSTAFGVLLSFVTSSPEFSVMVFLFKQKKYQMIVSGFFGSSIFNLTLPFYSNLISNKSIFGQNNYQDGSDVLSSGKISCWLIANLIMICMFLFTFWKKPNFRTTVISMSGIAIAVLYLVSVGLLANYK